MDRSPLVTIAIPSYNQGQFLNDALTSIFEQKISVEVFVMDGGSHDNTLEIIKKWQLKLRGWRSYSDGGQAAAINEGISQGRAPYVMWLNSDDWILPDSLQRLIENLMKYSNVPAVYGNAWNYNEKIKKYTPVWVEPFSEKRLSVRCIISQPATMIRRSAWMEVGGLDENLNMAMDYDLWWKLYKTFGPLKYFNDYIAVNREHDKTKTRNNRKGHYREAIAVVGKYHGTVPLKWFLARPYSVWFKAAKYWFYRNSFE